MAGPVTPEDVISLAAALIPEAVFGVFNDLIARDWDGNSVTVSQDEAVDLLLERDGTLDRDRIFSARMLNIEAAYRAAGWQVSYEKPGFNERGVPKFIFTKP